jgi:hypothetical protein
MQLEILESLHEQTSLCPVYQGPRPLLCVIGCERDSFV